MIPFQLKGNSDRAFTYTCTSSVSWNHSLFELSLHFRTKLYSGIFNLYFQSKTSHWDPAPECQRKSTPNQGWEHYLVLLYLTYYVINFNFLACNSSFQVNRLKLMIWIQIRTVSTEPGIQLPLLSHLRSIPGCVLQIFSVSLFSLTKFTQHFIFKLNH